MVAYARQGSIQGVDGVDGLCESRERRVVPRRPREEDVDRQRDRKENDKMHTGLIGTDAHSTNTNRLRRRLGSTQNKRDRQKLEQHGVGNLIDTARLGSRMSRDPQ